MNKSSLYEELYYLRPSFTVQAIRFQCDRNAELMRAINAECGGIEKIGYWLRSHSNQQSGNLKLVQYGPRINGSTNWKIIKIAEKVGKRKRLLMEQRMLEERALEALTVQDLRTMLRVIRGGYEAFDQYHVKMFISRQLGYPELDNMRILKPIKAKLAEWVASGALRRDRIGWYFIV